MKSKQEQMWESLKDKDFRQQIIDEHVNEGIAFQIRSLRNRQELTQSDLAQLLDVKQPLVSSWENPNYGKYTLKTLKELAKRFDVGLLVRFVAFSTLVDWTVDLTSDVITPPSFNEEQLPVPTAGAMALNLMTALEANNLSLTGFDKVPKNVSASTVNAAREEALV